MPLQCGQFSHKYSEKTPHGSPFRVRYGMSFVDSASDWYSAPVLANINAIPYNIRPRYTDTRLYYIDYSHTTTSFICILRLVPVEAVTGYHTNYSVNHMSLVLVCLLQLTEIFHVTQKVITRKGSIISPICLYMSMWSVVHLNNKVTMSQMAPNCCFSTNCCQWLLMFKYLWSLMNLLLPYFPMKGPFWGKLCQ